jgi:hypothetical protein
MKRALLVVALVVVCVAPSFAYNVNDLSLAVVPDFGWGIVANGGTQGPSFMLWVFPGDDWKGSLAWTRANIVMSRLVQHSAKFARVNLSQVYLTQVVGDEDYAIMVEAVEDGVLRKYELVTIDDRVSKAYGATNAQLGSFWIKRLKALAIMSSPLPAGPWVRSEDAGSNSETEMAKAILSNWRDWRSVESLKASAPAYMSAQF